MVSVGSLRISERGGEEKRKTTRIPHNPSKPKVQTGRARIVCLKHFLTSDCCESFCVPCKYFSNCLGFLCGIDFGIGSSTRFDPHSWFLPVGWRTVRVFSFSIPILLRRKPSCAPLNSFYSVNIFLFISIVFAGDSAQIEN